MTQIAENLTQLIGKTPLLKLSRFSAVAAPIPCTATLLGKLENQNPGASVKDRIALAMIEAAEQAGTLRPGGTIIEPTSGNTGIGLAWVAAVKGYKVVLTMPESMSLERRKLLQALGAEIVLTPAIEGMPGAVRRADALAKECPGAFLPLQFENPANPEAHYRTGGGRRNRGNPHRCRTIPARKKPRIAGHRRRAFDQRRTFRRYHGVSPDSGNRCRLYPCQPRYFASQ